MIGATDVIDAVIIVECSAEAQLFVVQLGTIFLIQAACCVPMLELISHAEEIRITEMDVA